MAVYPSTNGETSKVITPARKIPMTSGGRSSTGENGPTGSSRSYPKSDKLPPTTDNAPGNPQKVPPVDLYVGGVDL